MAMTLGDLTQAVRVQYPAFGREVVTTRQLGALATQLQRRLAMKATQRNSQILAQSLAIAFDLQTQNNPGVVGPGTAGGLPSEVVNGTAEVVEANVGNIVGYDLDNATVLVDSTVVTSATTNTLTVTGAAWTVNAYANQMLYITDGPGYGQLNTLASNTADTLTLASGETFTPDTPTSESVFQILDVPTEVATDGVVTGLPAYNHARRFLVQLDAGGNPVVDFDNPLITSLRAGIPLPPLDRILGATVVFVGADPLLAPQTTTAGPLESPLTLISYAMRLRPQVWPAAYTLGNELFLLGRTTDWTNVQNIDLRYVPIPPAFSASATATEEYFLLPDTAYDALVTGLARMCVPIALQKGVTLDPAFVQSCIAEADYAERTWLTQIGQNQDAARRMIPRNR